MGIDLMMYKRAPGTHWFRVDDDRINFQRIYEPPYCRGYWPNIFEVWCELREEGQEVKCWKDNMDGEPESHCDETPVSWILLNSIWYTLHSDGMKLSGEYFDNPHRDIIEKYVIAMLDDLRLAESEQTKP